VAPTAPVDEHGLDDPLRLPSSGSRAVRGGAVRVAGYAVGSALAAAASILLLRYLGVVDFGRYVTVMSLVAVVAGLTDVGLTLVGQREYVLQPTAEAKRELTANILGIRLLVTPIGVALAVLFALVAGYGTTLVLGTLVVGASLLFGNAALTFAIPLTAQLRLGALTATEVGRQLATVIGNALLVAVGAGLLAFFGVHVVAALAALVLAAGFLERRHLSRPRFSKVQWRAILAEAAPMGVAVVVGVLYLRALVVIASLLTSAYQTGLFATSYRILEILVAIPALMVGSAFPLMARAASDDDARLRYILQRLVETSLLIGVLFVIVLVIAAEPIVRILGGAEYIPAADVLRIQSFALLGSFASVLFTTALIAVRRQSALILINGLALVSVAALGGILIPSWGAKGAAGASVVGEALLAIVALAMLRRARPGVGPDFGFALRLVPAVVLGSACAFIPGIPALATGAIAVAAYSLAALAFGAVPSEVTDALTSWRRRPV
jgi:O-antigen/teichoic acid export membrane protein